MARWLTWNLWFLLIANVYTQEFFNTMPPPVNANFTCRGRKTGYYADIETNCRAYHACDENGNKFTYYCPAETAFRQEALICDHAHLVDCANGQRYSTITKILEDSGESFERNAMKNVASYPQTGITKNSTLINDNSEERGEDIFHPDSSNSAYTRSFKITPESRSPIQKSEYSSKSQPTFVLSSSVFLRDRANLKRNSFPTMNDRATTIDHSKPSGTFLRTSGMDFRAKEHLPAHSRSIPNFYENEKTSGPYAQEFPSTTTRRSLAAFEDSSRYEKFKLNYGSNVDKAGNLNNRRRELNNEKMSAPDKMSGVLKNGEETLTKERKLDANDSFQGQTASREKEFDVWDRERNGDAEDEFFHGATKSLKFSKNRERFNANSDKPTILTRNERPPFFFNNSNFPYSETLRSMQAMTEKSEQNNFPNGKSIRSSLSSIVTTSSPVTTAGTEFPVHPFPSTLSVLAPNEVDDDPYYPKRSTTTEVSYKLIDLDGEGKKHFRFTTKKPWPRTLNFEIPDVLPDLNAFDDLVDRRKYFYIPRVKAT